MKANLQYRRGQHKKTSTSLINPNNMSPMIIDICYQIERFDFHGGKHLRRAGAGRGGLIAVNQCLPELREGQLYQKTEWDGCQVGEDRRCDEERDLECEVFEISVCPWARKRLQVLGFQSDNARFSTLLLATPKSSILGLIIPLQIYRFSALYINRLFLNICATVNDFQQHLIVPSEGRRQCYQTLYKIIVNKSKAPIIQSVQVYLCTHTCDQ